MRVLLLGSGRREHTPACATAASRQLSELVIAPGNPGMAVLGRSVALNPSGSEAMLILSQGIVADLVVISPEAPLVAGVADTLRAAGLAVFDSSRAAARLEGSKTFAKEITTVTGVPTATSVAYNAPAKARAVLQRFGVPYVVK